jgi:hypothetical protein
MNKKLGLISSIVLTVTVILFALGMIIGKSNLSYFVCIILSWSYILLTCSLATEVISEKKAFAFGGIAFSCLYGVIINIVYYTQLTTVASKTASEEILNVLSYESLGSLMFNLNIFGYGLMAISTFLIGMAITPITRNDRWLKNLLMVHGIFAPSCVIIPMLNVFKSNSSDSDIMGIAVLLVWCIYFTPVGILSIYHNKH